MVAGAVITMLAFVQLTGPVRRYLPAVHRWSGRTLCLLAILTALGGLGYILQRGTIGGPAMSLAFAAYGVLMLGAAVETFRHARARRFDRHRRWGLRLAVLALGSWLYRVHYGVWEAATGGVGTAPDFSGWFDRVQLLAFYVPYLLILELRLRRGMRQERAPARG